MFCLISYDQSCTHFAQHRFKFILCEEITIIAILKITFRFKTGDPFVLIVHQPSNTLQHIFLSKTHRVLKKIVP